MKRSIITIVTACAAMLFFAACNLKLDVDPAKIIGAEHWLQMENGTLKQLPMPFADFTKGKKEIQAWEEKYKSVLINNDGDELLFISTIDKDLNPYRLYDLDKGILDKCAYALDKSLVLDKDGTNINENFQALLKSNNYTRTDIPGIMLFNNDTYKLAIVPAAKIDDDVAGKIKGFDPSKYVTIVIEPIND